MTFQLTRDGLTAYQYAVRDRVQKRARRKLYERPVVIWSAWAGALLAFTLGGLFFLEQFFGRRMEAPEFLFGLTLGVGAVYAGVWLHYLDQRRGLVRSDGPVLATQSLRAMPDGLHVKSKASELRYYWTAVEAITEQRGLLVFWVEPGAGLAVPVEALGTAEARARFVEIAEGYRAAAAVRA